ncbi:MAG: hydantoinase/oxoprolinase family protein [Betaproteobacteria bacterium]|nr:hydantoinase/oxoprolinase family protein [Betaproteobacteria bacterium]
METNSIPADNMSEFAAEQYLVGVDIGGTFTDLVAFEPATGSIVFSKARSTPRNLAAGIESCIAKSRVPMRAVDTLFHGSTVVINALIERKGAITGLVTTRGFRDVLEIGRGNRPENYNLFYRKPEPFVPRFLRFEVDERMDPEGNAVRPLSLADLAAVAQAAKRHKVEALAICFLHAYANAAHENEARQELQRLLPGVYICTSNEVACEWREFERTSTTVLNAFVGPNVKRYVETLEKSNYDAGFRGRFYLMRSNGGVMSPEHGKRLPVAMVESGPVAGMIGAAWIGTQLNEPLVVGFDMGGTTAKASLIENGTPKLVELYYVNGYARGYPLQVPTIEVVEVGTGGGSMAWLDETGALKVGPKSAGSEPGPVCVRNGGTEPTVTDANALLGRLNVDHYLGGEMTLDVAAAEKAIDEKIAKPLGLSAIDAAAGIITIANSNMALAVRGITIEKGVDPRDTALVAFGGGGPLHATEIARDIGIPKVIVPLMPACFSALGMLLADIRHDLVRTCVRPLAGDPGAVNGLLALLREEGRQTLLDAGTRDADVRCVEYLDLCYVGQQWTLPTPVGESTVNDGNVAAIRERFDAMYETRFGHSFPNLPLQIVNVRLAATGARPKPSFPDLPERTSGEPGFIRRRVYFTGSGFVDCPVYQRDTLLAGDRIDGPAVVEEGVATLLLHHGDEATVNRSGAIVIAVH